MVSYLDPTQLINTPILVIVVLDVLSSRYNRLERITVMLLVCLLLQIIICIFTREQNLNIVIVSLADDVHFLVKEEERQRMKIKKKMSSNQKDE